MECLRDMENRRVQVPVDNKIIACLLVEERDAGGDLILPSSKAEIVGSTQ
jgi:hypothetical protein